MEQLAGQADDNRFALLAVDPALIEDLDAWSVVDRSLAHDDLTAPRLRLADGSRVDLDNIAEGVQRPAVAATDISPGRAVPLHQAMLQGRTVVENHLGPRVGGPLAEVVNDLSRVTATPAQVNVYLSEREAPGFGRHWDDHDVIILQCAGRKYWEVFEPATLSSMVGYTDKRTFGDSVWSGVLEPGSALYIPRGWGHQVSGFAGEVSLHYTIGLRRMTLVDLITWESVAGTSTSLRSWVDPDATADVIRPELLDDDEVDHLVGRWRTRLLPLPVHGPLTVADAASRRYVGTIWHAPWVGGVTFAELDDRDPNAVDIAGAGGVFRVHESVIELVAATMERKAVPFDELVELTPDRDPATAAAVLRTLAEVDLVQLCRT